LYIAIGVVCGGKRMMRIEIIGVNNEWKTTIYTTLLRKDRKCLQTKKKSRCVFAMAQFNCFEEN
jgi:hypothetical protein